MVLSLSRRTLLASALFAPLPLKANNFNRDFLLNTLREMARTPFQPNQSRVLTAISAEQYAAIKYKRDIPLNGFTLEPLHQGQIFQTPTKIFLVENGVASEIVYNADDFDGLPAKEPARFSGFRLMKNSEELIKFQAGTTFRTKANAQVFGTLARALAINVGEATGEEFPAFKTYYIEKESGLIHGLFESESLAGIITCKFEFNENTSVDINLTLLPRTDLTHIGIAPQTGMYLFGANDKANIDDYRGSVHEITGLQMLSGREEWIYRPAHNPETLQFSSFMDNNPKGFGLVQRERRFETFQDLEGQFERRPSLWVEPLGEWGEGQVQLVEIPSESQQNKNIIAYWKPKRVLTARQEVNFNYKLHFAWNPTDHSFAEIVQTRIGRAPNRRRRFIVDFSGEIVNSPEKLADLTPNLNVQRGKFYALSMRFNPEIQGARVSFELEPEGTSSELRLTLDNNNKHLSETWLYRWTPP